MWMPVEKIKIPSNKNEPQTKIPKRTSRSLVMLICLMAPVEPDTQNSCM
jgi:hypothetical protein